MFSCDRQFGEKILAGETELSPSENPYDWLGHGIYFWENNAVRALEWARERMRRKESNIEEPFAIGAIIDPGFAFNFLQADHLKSLSSHFKKLREYCEEKQIELPQNSGGKDRLNRSLDCAVIQTIHETRAVEKLRPFDTVRSVFTEGDPVYPTAGFHEQNHLQICVRNTACIKGYFRIR